MAIHHMVTKKAASMGVQLTELDDGRVRAFLPSRGMEAIEADGKSALAAIEKKYNLAQLEEWHGKTNKAEEEDNDDGEGSVEEGPVPQEEGEEAEAEAGDDEEGGEGAEPARSVGGIFLDGRLAYEEGTMTADCPFDAESDDEEERARADAWYTAWDAAADDAAEADEKESAGGSVVSQKYRARYAEDGHPTHCGDWLAETLNGIVANKAGTNLELFESILSLNGVSVEHLDRTKRGWEGRLRMTGRNLLARKVFLNNQLVLPDTLGGVKTPDAEWVATRKFKKAS